MQYVWELIGRRGTVNKSYDPYARVGFASDNGAVTVAVNK